MAEPRREGSREGPAEVAFDAGKKANFHVLSNGEKVYHEVPAGFTFDPTGSLSQTPAGKKQAEEQGAAQVPWEHLPGNPHRKAKAPPLNEVVPAAVTEKAPEPAKPDVKE